MKVWELPAGRLVKTIALRAVPAGVAFTPDGMAVSVTAEDGTVWVWNARA